MTLPLRPPLVAPTAGAAAPVIGVLAGAAAIGAAIAARPLLALAGVVVLAALLAVLMWPDFATLLVVFLVYLNAPSVAVNTYGMPVTVAAMFPLLLTAPLAVRLLRRERLVVVSALIPLILYLLVQLLSTMFSSHLLVAEENVKTFMIEGVLLFFLVTNAIRTPQTLRRVLAVLVATAALLGALTLFQYVTRTYYSSYGGFSRVDAEFFLGLTETPRFVGPIGDPNYFAQILLPVVPIALVLVWGDRGRLLRIAAVAGLVFAAVGVVLTFSRGAGLAFLLLFVIMLFLRYIKPYQALIVVLGVVLLLTTVPAYKERVSSVVTSLRGATAAEGAREDADQAVQGRTGEMIAAAQVFVDNPVLGVGPGVFPSYYQAYAARGGVGVHETVKFGANKGAVPEREAHNMFLSVAAELGALGLLLFLTILYVTVRDLVRARRRSLVDRPELANIATALILALLSYVICGVFLTLAFERYFWLLLALAASAGYVSLREARAAPPAASAA